MLFIWKQHTIWEIQHSAYLNMCKMVCMTYIDNTTFKNFRYTLHITTDIFVTCRFTSMTHGPTIEPRGMFSTALAKHKTALGKHKIFKNNFLQLKIATFMIYYSNILKYIHVSSIDPMLFFLNWAPQTLSEFRVLNKKK